MRRWARSPATASARAYKLSTSVYMAKVGAPIRGMILAACRQRSVVWHLKLIKHSEFERIDSKQAQLALAARKHTTAMLLNVFQKPVLHT